MNVYIFSVPLSTIILYGMNIANFLTHKYFNIHSIFLVKTKRVSKMELFYIVSLSNHFKITISTCNYAFQPQSH